jgi:hypothetical protein
VRTLQETTLADLVLAPTLLNPIADGVSLANGTSLSSDQKKTKTSRGAMKSIAPKPEPLTTGA